jgi:hypothetical protein
MRRRIFGSKRNEITGRWRQLHNGGFNSCTHTIYRLTGSIKSKRMRLAGHVARMGMRNAL